MAARDDEGKKTTTGREGDKGTREQIGSTLRRIVKQRLLEELLAMNGREARMNGRLFRWFLQQSM